MAILKQISITGALMFLTTGCFTDFEPDIESTPVLCMNSTITAGDSIAVLLTHTWRWSDDTIKEKDLIVADAEVMLYVNDEYQETLQFVEFPQDYYDPYLKEDRLFGYISTHKAQEGDRIRLTAHSDKYGDASAEVTVPYRIDITKADYDIRQFNSLEEYRGTRYSMSLNTLIRFTDRMSTTDYYQFRVSAHNPESYYLPGAEETGENRCSAYISYYKVDYDKEPLFTEHVSPLESAVSETSGYTIFSDRQISGKEYPLHISIDNIQYYYNNPENNPGLKTASIDLHLDVISRSYYNHVLSVWEHNDGINGILGDVGLADPVWDGSNVSTGAGVVAAKSTSTYKLYLQNIVEKEDGQ